MTTEDIWRATVFFNVGMIVFLSAVIAVVYAVLLSRSKPAERSQRSKRVHVLLISLSYIGLVIYVVRDIQEYLGREITWRVSHALPCLILGNVALSFMCAHLLQNRMIFSGATNDKTEGTKQK